MARWIRTIKHTCILPTLFFRAHSQEEPLENFCAISGFVHGAGWVERGGEGLHLCAARALSRSVVRSAGLVPTAARYMTETSRLDKVVLFVWRALAERFN